MYTDPGVLSMLVAAAVGAIIAVPTYLILFRKKIGDYIYGRKKQKEVLPANDKGQGEL